MALNKFGLRVENIDFRLIEDMGLDGYNKYNKVNESITRENGNKNKNESEDSDEVDDDDDTVKKSKKPRLSQQQVINEINDRKRNMAIILGKVMDARNALPQSTLNELNEEKKRHVMIPVNHNHPSVSFPDECLIGEHRDKKIEFLPIYHKGSALGLTSTEKYFAYLYQLDKYIFIEDKMNKLKLNELPISIQLGRFAKDFEVNRIFPFCIQKLDSHVDPFFENIEGKPKLINGLKTARIILIFCIDEKRACYFGVTGKTVISEKDELFKNDTMLWLSFTQLIDASPSEEVQKKMTGLMLRSFTWRNYFYFFCDCEF